MSWVLVIGVTWVVLAAAAAVLIAGAVRVADRQASDTVVGDLSADQPNFVVDRPVVDRPSAEVTRTTDPPRELSVPTPRGDQATRTAAPHPRPSAPPPTTGTP
ncbi:hypothetical protein [Blastococcus sp. CT_GayMR19]|uniref:hypothetical protein n=1 Tax=Blastococcus sp. CT_GayMR19 TaxID=2559608 RepID=UPI00107353E1|nr:hypothetical protein [Blastococcus sp. CT_GayMR19]